MAVSKKKKDDKPSVATYADHEVIHPPNKLRKAVVTLLATDKADDPLARAEQALSELSSEFGGWMVSECERLDTARHQVKAVGFNKDTRDALFHAAHDIKGEAATFGFPDVAASAESLCRLIEHTPDATRIPLALVDQHVDAIRAIIRERRSRRHSAGRRVDTDFTRRHRRVSRQREPRPPRCARGNSSPFPRPGAVFLIQHYVAATRRHRSLFSLSATRDRGVTRPRLSSLAVCN